MRQPLRMHGESGERGKGMQKPEPHDAVPETRRRFLIEISGLCLLGITGGGAYALHAKQQRDEREAREARERAYVTELAGTFLEFFNRHGAEAKLLSEGEKLMVLIEFPALPASPSFPFGEEARQVTDIHAREERYLAWLHAALEAQEGVTIGKVLIDPGAQTYAGKEISEGFRLQALQWTYEKMRWENRTPRIDADDDTERKFLRSYAAIAREEPVTTQSKHGLPARPIPVVVAAVRKEKGIDRDWFHESFAGYASRVTQDHAGTEDLPKLAVLHVSAPLSPPVLVNLAKDNSAQRSE